MKIKIANDIILNDPNFLDIFKWKKKHFKAYDTYLKYHEGIPKSYRVKILKKIKNTVKRKE